MATLTERRTQLAEERANIDVEQRKVLDEAAAAGRALTAEERQADDKFTSRFDEVTDELRRIDRQLERERELRAAPAPVGGDAEDRGHRSQTEERARVIASSEYRDAFGAYLRGGVAALSAEARSTLNVGTDADGGFTVPEEWMNRVTESKREFGAIGMFAERMVTDSGRPIHLPRVSADATGVTIIGEGVSIPDDAETFDEVNLGAFGYKKIVKASEEFVEDTSVSNLAGWIQRRGLEDIDLAFAAHVATGTGTGQPQGLAAAATVGKTAALTTAFTGDEIIDLMHSVRSPYWPTGRFFANDLVIAAIRKLKDSENNYIWQIGIKEGEPDRLLGKPIHAEPFMASSIAASAKVLGFGDAFNAYIIREVKTASVKYLQERFADNGQVAWRFIHRRDGRVNDVEAFKTLQMAAS